MITLYLYINRDKIGFFKFLLEGYEGMAVLSTIDPQQGLVKVILPYSRYDEFIPFLDSISADLVDPDIRSIN